jgi:hypothetical protein
MRDIELAAYNLKDWRTDTPWGRAGADLQMLQRFFWRPFVMLPHIVAAALGVARFLGGLLNLPRLAQLQP